MFINLVQGIITDNNNNNNNSNLGDNNMSDNKAQKCM